MLRSLVPTLIALLLAVGDAIPAAAAGPAVGAVAGSALGAAAAAATVRAAVREVRVSPVPSSLARRCSEPSVAAHPTDPRRIAVACVQGAGPILPMIRISRDGGLTWRSTASRPGGGGIHIVVAWGPGPKGRARLYVANMTGTSGNLRLGITWSDDEGAHWSPMKVQADVPGWVGGTPDIITDDDPASPNHGVVYAAWNWPRSRTAGPGLRVIASSDHGNTWHGVEVPALTRTPGFPAAARIGYRLAAAGDGALLVDWYQADLRRWSSAAPLEVGSLDNVGRIRIGVARLLYDRGAGAWRRGPSLAVAELPRTRWNVGIAWPDGLATGPQWTASIKVDRASGAVLVAVSVDGRIRVYRSADGARGWTYATLPDPPTVKGRAQYIAKPDLVVGDGFVFVAMRMFDRNGATSGHAWSVSTDGGRTFTRPKAVAGPRWSPARVSGGINGVGLRDRAAVAADGRRVVFAYGDGRFGATGANLVATFAAIVTVAVPAATPAQAARDQAATGPSSLGEAP